MNKKTISKSSNITYAIGILTIILASPNLLLQIEIVRTKYTILVVAWNFLIIFVLLKAILSDKDKLNEITIEAQRKINNRVKEEK
jgi:hypothetical protein